jgi:hypothetical protein
MKKAKQTEQSVINLELSRLSSVDGDCFGSYEGTDNQCLLCHDSHACAFLKQGTVFQKAAEIAPKVSIGNDGLFIADFDTLVQPGEAISELVLQVKNSNTHLSESLITMKLKAYCLANGLVIRAGKVEKPC